jgi:hypothetical protein
VLVLDIDEAEADKLLLSLDPLAALAETNAVALDSLLREVDTGSEALQQMYADLADAADLYKDGEKEIVEDEVPEPPADPITKPGDLWLLGDHRLLCGDSTKAEDVERLMAGLKADCIVTDPPYGIGIASNPVRQAHTKSDWDAKPVDPTQMIQGRPSIVWGGNYFALPPSKGFLVWDKKQPEDFTLAMCEMAWTNVDTPAKMFRKSVVSYAKEHPTQKPVELLAWCMGFVDGSVYDPFLGSGTTLIAAEQLGRKCYGMEISPQYCDVIVKRRETLTGKKATKEVNDGQARPATGADDHQDGEGQPRQKAAQQKRAKAGR